MKTIDPAVSASEFTRWLAIVFLGAALLVDIGVRVRMLDFPLERDEGEYAYVGQLILQGIPPYQLAGNMKLPGIYLAYAIGMAVFGQTPAGIHLGLLAAHLATLAALFLIARHLLDVPSAAVATAAYGLMTLSPAYLGLAAHATHFVMLAALPGLYLLLRAQRNDRLLEFFAAGCFLGAAFIMKQPGALFGIFGGLYLAWGLLARKIGGWQALARLGAYSAGCLLPFLIICLWLEIAGVFPQFWFWTMTYTREYGTAVALPDGLHNARRGLGLILRAAPCLWMVAGTGLAGLFLAELALDKKIFLAGFLVFSAMAVCPGLYFREHYFILLAPAIALLAGVAAFWSYRRLAREVSQLWPYDLPLLVAAFACCQSLYTDREVYFSLTPRQACRKVYSINPFIESLDIARKIEENTDASQRILVMGDEPQINFYSHRISSTSQIYPSQLMDPRPFAREMQERMIHEIEQNPPAYLIFVAVPTSWLAKTNSIGLLFDWENRYVKENMEAVGLIQINLWRTTEVWGPDAGVTPLESKFFVAIYQKRKSHNDQKQDNMLNQNALRPFDGRF